MLSATALKVVPRLLPMFCMAAMAATAIRAAIRPYSMAVAPSSFLKILRMSFIFRSPVPKLWKSTLPAPPCPCGRTVPDLFEGSFQKVIDLRVLRGSAGRPGHVVGNVAPHRRGLAGDGVEASDHRQDDERADQPIFDRA